MTERLRRTTWSRAIRVSLAFVVAGSMVSVATAGRGIADPITGHGVVAPPKMVNLGVNVNGLSTDAKTNLVDVATFAGVQVIRGRTNQVTASIPHPTVYGGYVGPSVDPHRDLICVASYSFTTTPSLVYVINGRTNKVIRKMSAGGPCEDGIAINPVTNRLYVPNNVTGRVSVIDAATAKLVTTSNVGGRLGVAAIDATTNTIYVTHLEVGYSPASPTSVNDGRTDKVLGTVSTGYEPLNLGVDQETHRVYVADLPNRLSMS